jgi:hypothetical protein
LVVRFAARAGRPLQGECPPGRTLPPWATSDTVRRSGIRLFLRCCGWPPPRPLPNRPDKTPPESGHEHVFEENRPCGAPAQPLPHRPDAHPAKGGSRLGRRVTRTGSSRLRQGLPPGLSRSATTGAAPAGSPRMKARSRRATCWPAGCGCRQLGKAFPVRTPTPSPLRWARHRSHSGAGRGG